MNGQSKQSKTDKALPAYCNPPNPCPVGKTGESICKKKKDGERERDREREIERKAETKGMRERE